MSDCYASNGLPSKCNLCQKSESPCVDVQNDHRRVLTVAELTHVPSWNIRKILSCICSRCLLFIGSLTESSNLLRLNCTNALKGQSTTHQTSVTSNPTVSSSVLHQTLTPSPDIVAHNVEFLSQTTATAKIAENKKCQTQDVGIQVIEYISRTPSPQNQLLSLLEIHHERNVSPLATESGGVHYGESNNWPSWIPKAAQRECPHCDRLFKRKTDYNKHYRRCLASKMRYSKSMGSTRRKSMYQDDLNSIASEGAKENGIQSRPPRFQCPHCPAAFKSMLTFKQHTLLHRTQFKCDICGCNNATQYLFDFHRAECISKLEVRKENEALARKQQQLPARRKTRACSLYVSQAAENKLRGSTNDMPNDQITGKECVDATTVNKAKTVVNSRNCNNTGAAVTNKSNSQVIRHAPIPNVKIARKYVCLLCNSSFRRKDYYKRHYTICKLTKPCYVKLLSSLPSRKCNQSRRLLETPRRPPSFPCTQCPSSFETLVHLNKHALSHRQHYNCDICGYSNASQYLFDFHRAECISKLEVRKENEAIARKQQQLPARRKTRAYSLYISLAAECKSSDARKDMQNDRITGKKKCLDATKTNRAKTETNNDSNPICEPGEISANTKSNSQVMESPPLDTQKLVTQYECLHCKHSFRSIIYYKKHSGRCLAAKLRRCKSLNILSSDKDGRVTPEQHHCLQCSDTFHSKFQLRGHMRLHSNRFNCGTCDRKCITQRQLCLHQEECMGTGNKSTAGNQQLPPRRVTRSYTQDFFDIALASAENNSKDMLNETTNKSEIYTNKNLKTTASNKRKYCENTVKKDKSFNLTNSPCQDDPPQTKNVHLTISDNVRGDKISTTVSEDTHTGYPHEYEDDDDDTYEEYCEDDDVSVADSIYTRRLSYTNRWLETHCNLISHTGCNENKSNVFKDLNLLERLKREVDMKEITCYEPNCSYTTIRLNSMMYHDYSRHYKYSWFFCPKCGKCFTSKIFLDYHLDIQDRGHNYLCHKCGFCFLRRHEFHRHLLQHMKQSADEVENLTCNYCNFVFLDKQSLTKHCVVTGHDWRKKRQFIRIDHSRTITNMVALESSTTLPNKYYSEKHIEMHTVPLPRQQSISRRMYNTKLRVGTIEFKEPWRANCVGMFGRH